MANKKTKTSKKTKNPELYYFYSVGCGFCKKVDPIVDELIKDGNDILKLDISDPENQKISQELQILEEHLDIDIDSRQALRNAIVALDEIANEIYYSY